jgi:DNA replication protein DnaC
MRRRSAIDQDIERRDLLAIIEDRSGNRSTILTDQKPTKSWHDYTDAQTIADSICDRLLHNAHRIDLGGESRREDENKRS